MKDTIKNLQDEERIAALLKGLDDDLTVPLNVSASWRKAVRKASRRQRLLGRTRWIVEIAAAVALIVGATSAWRNLGTTVSGPAESADIGVQQASIASDYVFYRANTPSQVAGALLFSDGADDVFDDLEMDTYHMDLTASVENIETAAAKTVEAETEGAEIEDVFTHIADISITDVDPAATEQKLREIVEKVPGAYFEQIVSGDTSSNGKIRVPNAQLDELLAGIKSQFHCSVRRELRNVSRDYLDLTAKIETAYNTIDELQILKAQSASAEETAQLNSRLQLLYDEIDGYERNIEQSKLDLEYATVYYQIDTQAIAEATATAAVKAGTQNSFALDMLTVLAILLPTALLSCLITLHVVKSRYRKQKY